MANIRTPGLPVELRTRSIIPTVFDSLKGLSHPLAY